MANLKSIQIFVIPHQNQRYDTTGDWNIIKGEDILIIRVSDTGFWFHNMLIALHEFVEAVLCTFTGISPQMVDSFDLSHKSLTDPGAASEAPYHQEHMAADAIERTVCQLAGISWNDYEMSINNLPQWKEKHG